MFGLESIVEEREAQVKEAIGRLKQEANDQARLQILLSALAEIREAIAESVVDKVTVTNQDEIKAALHNELNRISKPIIKAIDNLALDKSKLEEIKRNIEAQNAVALEENFDLQIIRKPKQRLEIGNLGDIAFPDTFGIRNLSDLEKYFKDLEECIKESYNIEIPAPQVTVNPPDVIVPEIRIPEQSVSIDIERLLEALDPLKFLSDRANKPLAVRLSDGQKFLQTLRTIVDNQQKQVAAFSQGINANDLRREIRAGHGRTLKSVTGSTSVDVDIVAAVATKRIKVYSVSLTTISTTAVTVTMQSNASTAIRTYRLQGPASVTVGIAESTECPTFLFATTAGEKLTLDVSAAVTVFYNVSYWDDDTA